MLPGWMQAIKARMGKAGACLAGCTARARWCKEYGPGARGRAVHIHPQRNASPCSREAPERNIAEPIPNLIWFGLGLDKVPALLKERGGELGACPARRKYELNAAPKRRQARGIKETSQLLPVENPFQQLRRWMEGARPPRSSPRYHRKPPGPVERPLGKGMLQARCTFGGSLLYPGRFPARVPGCHHLHTPQGSWQGAIPRAGSRGIRTAPSSPTSAAARGQSLRETLLPTEAKGEGASEELRQLLVACCLHSACSEPALAIAANLIACDERETLCRNRGKLPPRHGLEHNERGCKEMLGSGRDGGLINTGCVYISLVWVLCLALHRVPAPNSKENLSCWWWLLKNISGREISPARQAGLHL
ncbi:uncharacterized protein LOC118172198 [Oxyura jamaicensis]|uniref:uncharacterized protein LOC118172198 n=1 Tax=Oxyura jamaicensis TaxID=8884 RepID=UPI0015A6EADD|nr:uncharacterized protein LOC118172198 [Oxyura jamaicensis]